MADNPDHREPRSALARAGRALLALGFGVTGLTLAVIALTIGMLNIPAARKGLLDAVLTMVNDGQLTVEIGRLGGEWPGRLRLRDLAIGDADGVWLRVTKADLDWRPLALWRGELHVTRLDLTGLNVERLPGTDKTADSEGALLPALPALPALPVALRLDAATLADATLGRDAIGTPVTLEASGRAMLTRDLRQLDLKGRRLDGVPGEVEVHFTFFEGPERGRLRLRIEDGGKGQPGIAAHLMESRDFERLVLTADGQSLAGLMTGTATLDAGEAARVDASAHGAIDNRLNMTFAGEASGTLVARELAALNGARSIGVAGKLAKTNDATFKLNDLTVETGDLTLTGGATARRLGDGGFGVDGKGRLAGLDRMLGEGTGDVLAAIGWKIKGETNAGLTRADFEDAEVTTRAGVARFTAKASMEAGILAVSGDGAAEISDLAPLGDLTGQKMRGTASVALSSFAFEDGKGSGTLSVRTSAIETPDDGLNRLLAEGVAGDGTFAFDDGFSFSDVSVSAGDALHLDGSFSLSAKNVAAGEASLHMADVSALLSGETASGALDAKARIDGPLNQADLTLDATLSKGMLAGFDAKQATLSAKLNGGEGPVAFQLDGADGHASLNTTLALRDGGGARLDPIRANAFGTVLTGTLSISPDGLIDGGIGGERVALQPLAGLAGMTLEGRGDIAVAFAARAGKQDARVTLAARRIDIQMSETLTLEQVAADIAVADLFGSAAVDGQAGAESGSAGNTRFTTIEARAMGPLDRLDISAKLSGERLMPQAEPVAANIEARYEPGLLTLERMAATVGKATMTLDKPLALETGAGVTRVTALALGFDGPEGGGQLTGSAVLSARSARVKLDMTKLPLELVSPFLPMDAVGGTASGTADLDTGRQKGTAMLSFSNVRLTEARLDIRPAFDAELDATWAKQRLDLKAQALGVSEQPFLLDLSLPLIRDPRGAWPILPERGPVAGKLDWRGPIASLMAMADLPGQRLTGDTTISLSVEGDISKPLMSGKATIAKGGFENFETGTAMRDLDLTIKGERSEVLSFTMSASDNGKGRVTADGTLSIGTKASPAVDIRTHFTNMQVVSRRDLVLSVSGDLSLTGEALPPDLDKPLLLEGALTTTSARFHVPEKLPGGVAHIDVIEVHGADEADLVEDPEAAPPLPLMLDVTLAIGNPPAHVTGRGVDSLWTGSIAVTGLAEEPIVEGTLTSLRGTLDFAGKTFVLSRGRVVFNGGGTIDPLIDIALDYDRSDFTATVAVTGRGSSPKINLSSQPSLPRDEIISRVLFEKGVGELSALEAAQLANTAAELSGNGVGGFGVLGQIQETLGLDVLRVDQGSSGATTVSAGKYVREDVYVGVEQGALASDSSVKMEIDLTDNISVDTKLGQDASGDVGINWKWDY